MMAEGFDFSCDLCLIGLRCAFWAWSCGFCRVIFPGISFLFFIFLFYIYIYIYKRICCDVESVGGSALVDGFDFW